MLSVKKEAVNTNFKIIGLTRLGIKPKSTAPEADALTTRPSEQLLVFTASLVLVFTNGRIFLLSWPS